jgi:hypothetical protein
MNTKSMGIALLSAASLLGGTAAQAELPWTYAEFGYSRADGVEDFAETDAFDLKASVGFATKWHASLAYTDGETDFGTSSDDFDGYRLIVGAHPQLTTNTQLVTDLTYFDYDFDGGEGTSGYGIGLGLRHAVTDKLEVMGEVWYTEGEIDSDSPFIADVDYNDTTVEVGGRYNWLPELSTGLTVSLGGSSASSSFGGDEAIRFDLRWAFLGDLSK